MNDSIIVTLIGKNDSFKCDLEFPTEIPLNKMTAFLKETLSYISPAFSAEEEGFSLRCQRTGKKLDLFGSLNDNGVQNGDYIMIVEKS